MEGSFCVTAVDFHTVEIKYRILRINGHGVGWIINFLLSLQIQIAKCISVYLPLTTSLTGWLVRASCVWKSLAVTWHSHVPSSNWSWAALIHMEQSPVSCDPDHSYLCLYMPTGCKKRWNLWGYLGLIAMHERGRERSVTNNDTKNYIGLL